MKEKQLEIKPFLSVFILVLTLFSMVFLKMEIRRMGYSVLKQAREYEQLQDAYRLKSLEYSKKMSPENLRSMAVRKLTLSEAQGGQIIHMSNNGIAVKQ